MKLISLKAALATATLSIALFVSTPISGQSTFDQRFTNYPTYSGDDLELKVDDKGTHFRLWSPMAEAVELSLYANGRTGEAYSIINMSPDKQSGCWTVDLPGQLYGNFYTFRVKHNGEWLDETPGVWAKAVGINGKRAAVLDLTTTNPQGWENDRGPEVKNFQDVVIYEMHHRDISVHPSSGIANKGKFLALTESGTISPEGLKTGIDHLKELGVTHVHILPSYDFNSVDETQLPSNTYNWGYDPVNYNAPEGSYSTNPSDPATRISEMKQMIKALHDTGMGVIMDVVYNHTAENDKSNFELTAPGYYHRHWDDGRYSDASGCGNETASERKQMSDFIVNSAKFWAEEYHIDGFRFDLMAIHDIETMNHVAEELKKLNPSLLVYGEGWTAGDSPLAAERRALKENVSGMKDIAVFSDDIRDAVKGHYADASGRGFASGQPGLEETVKIGIVASTAHPQVDYSKGNYSKKPYADSPSMVVNYVSCHDDLCLTDKLRKSIPDVPDSVRKRIARLAQTIVFTSQGTPFMFAGEEIWRDKQGVHNSYKSPDSINAIDWRLKAQNIDQFEYYRNVIAMRKAHPAFRMTDSKQIATHIVFDEINSDKTPNLVSYTITGNANGDSWRDIKIVFNGSDQTRVVSIPKGKWQIIAHDGVLNPDGLGQSRGGKMEVTPYSALILAR